MSYHGHPPAGHCKHAGKVASARALHPSHRRKCSVVYNIFGGRSYWHFRRPHAGMAPNRDRAGAGRDSTAPGYAQAGALIAR